MYNFWHIVQCALENIAVEGLMGKKASNDFTQSHTSTLHIIVPLHPLLIS